MQAALDWITPGAPVSSSPLAGGTVNKVLFLSDGEPEDNLNNFDEEIAAIEALGFTIEAVGLNVGAAALDALDEVDSNGDATNVVNPSDLTATVGNLVGGTTIPTSTGSDVINGAAGNDIIFGDVPFTDTLADLPGLGLASTPNGSGWAVFQTLEGRLNAEPVDPAGNGADWTRADTIAYIQQNQGQIAQESGRTGGHDVIDGGTGSDTIYAQEGDDQITGDDSDALLDGGSGIDTLKVGANFTSSSNAQIAKIENVTLTAAATLNLSNQTEGFTITGSAGVDQITGGSGNDTVVGAQNDTLLAGGGGIDTLNIGANFDDTGDGQITGIENVVLTGAATLNLGQQTEGFTITGSAGVDQITGGSGNDTVVGAHAAAPRPTSSGCGDGRQVFSRRAAGRLRTRAERCAAKRRGDRRLRVSNRPPHPFPQSATPGVGPDWQHDSIAAGGLQR